MSTVTGHQLIQTRSLLQIQRDSLESEFEDSLTSFEGEKKRPPLDIANEIRVIEGRIAVIEMAQSYYNLQVTIEVNGKEITLCEAVKAVGGINRDKDRWKKLYKVERNRFSHRDMSRSTEQKYATWNIDKAQVTHEAKKSTKVAGQFKAAIAQGNGEKVDISFLDAALIEK